MKKIINLIVATSAMLFVVRVAFAEQLIANVCWGGVDVEIECVNEYLISSAPLKKGNVKVRVRDEFSIDGRVSKSTQRDQRDVVISCKKRPPNDHATAIEYTRWMYVCKGEKTEWSPEAR